MRITVNVGARLSRRNTIATHAALSRVVHLTCGTLRIDRDHLAAAIAALKGSRQQKRLALVYAERNSEKEAAIACGVKLPTAKVYMKRIYAANGVDCIVHLVVVGFCTLLNRVRHDLSPTRLAGDLDVDRCDACHGAANVGGDEEPTSRVYPGG